MKRWNLLFIGITLCCFQCVAGRGRWVISIQTANNWMAGYVGDVTVCLGFESPKVVENSTLDPIKSNKSENLKANFVKEDCQVLPRRHFERGKFNMFAIEFAEDAPLEKARIFAKPLDSSVCKKSPEDTWHIADVTFQNLQTGEFFEQSKSINHLTSDEGMLVETKCGSRSKEINLNVFNRSVRPRPCPGVDGIIYKHGESFEEGCTGLCACDDGGVGCVSRCPPSIAPGCRQVYIPGECCTTWICQEEDEDMHCPLYEASDCETSNRTVDPGENPWMAFIKFNDGHRFCSGALLNDKWVLTAAECLSRNGSLSVDAKDIRVIVGEHSLILAEDSDVEYGVDNITMGPSGSLTLLKLKEMVSFDRAVQPVILPLDKDQCLQLVEPSCALSMTGWINIGASEAEQYELYKLTTRVEESNVCSPLVTGQAQGSRKRKPPPPTKPKDGAICMDLGTTDPPLHSECGTCQDLQTNSPDVCTGDKNAYLCSGERGRTLVSKVLVQSFNSKTPLNYLVGIISYQLPPNESPTGLCKKPAFPLAINICQEVNWIKGTINTY